MLNLCLARSAVLVGLKIGMRIPWEIYPLMLCERLYLWRAFFFFSWKHFALRVPLVEGLAL